MTTSVVYGTNSYISLEDAETYFSNRLHSTVWSSASATDKDKALITATKRINSLRFKGFVCDQTQPLQFPRYVKPNYLSKHTYTDRINLVSINGQNVIYIDISTELKEATCEEAIALLEFGNSAHLKNQQLGIKSVSFGGTSSSYEATGNGLLSNRALQLIDKYLQKMGKVV